MNLADLKASDPDRSLALVVWDRWAVHWDLKYNRPIHDSGVTNPHTGLIEEASQNNLTLCPPCIDFFVYNARLSPVENRFTGMSTSLVGTMEEAIAEIGEHARKELYRIMSLNASKYSVVLVLYTDGTHHDVGRAFTEIKQKMMISTFEKSRAALAATTPQE